MPVPYILPDFSSFSSRTTNFKVIVNRIYKVLRFYFQFSNKLSSKHTALELSEKGVKYVHS